MTSKAERLLDKAKGFDETFKAMAEEDAGPPREANVAARIRSIAARMMKHPDPEVQSMAGEILEHVKVLEGK